MYHMHLLYTICLVETRFNQERAAILYGSPCQRINQHLHP